MSDYGYRVTYDMGQMVVVPGGVEYPDRVFIMRNGVIYYMEVSPGEKEWIKLPKLPDSG